jgi:uncharacterized protein with HEPN domain
MSQSWKLFLQDIIDSGSKVIGHDDETLWDVIVNKLPTLLNIAQRIQKEQLE